MKCLCEKGSGPCSVHSSSSYVLGCPSWLTCSESEVRKSSSSKSLSLKEDVLPQQCHKSKALSIQFHEMDSSSNQSTGQSYPEVGSTLSVQNPIQHSNSSAGSKLSGTEGKSVAGLIRSPIEIRDFAFAPPPHGHNQSLAHIALHYADPYYTDLLAATFGPQYKIMEARIPMPLDPKEPIYVNSKQYHAILRRRHYRAKLEAHNKSIKDRKPYRHESRHIHALKRARGAGGRFVNTKKLQEPNLALANHGQENVGRDMQDYTADKGGGVNRHGLSVFM
ncbi:hypothetical protein RIF29_27975 [Crotalaria pallida]|uniref:Nuclear transcription factor Y subunit n=1 Tax=Crotalaria pallida TaxID=3830 RepID=A0AAN9EQ31_CROPI